MLILHMLNLPTSLQARSFVDFVQERYLPALHTGSTRLGQLETVQVLRRRESGSGDPPHPDRQFLLLSAWNGLATTHLPRIDDPVVDSLFAAYNVAVEPLGCFDLVGELQRS